MNTIPLEIVQYIGNYLSPKIRIRCFFKALNLIENLKYSFDKHENRELLKLYIREGGYHEILQFKKDGVNIIHSMHYAVLYSKKENIIHLFLTSSNFVNDTYKTEYLKSLKFCLKNNEINKIKTIFGYFEHDNNCLITFLKLFICKFFIKHRTVNACIKYVLKNLSSENVARIRAYCFNVNNPSDYGFIACLFMPEK